MNSRRSDQHNPQRLRRDLAADLSLSNMELWSDLPEFFGFLVDQSLSKDLRPNHSSDPYADETDTVAVFLTSLVVAGAFARKTIHMELATLTTANVPLYGKWFQIDAYKPTIKKPSSHRPSKRLQQLRFPLPLLCQALLFRVARFYEVHSTNPRSPLFRDEAHTINWVKSNQPLFSGRIRANRRFLVKWLMKAYVDFQKTQAADSSDADHHKSPWSHPFKKFSWNQFLTACQARMLATLPPWVVASLRQRWKSTPCQLWDIERSLLGKDMRYTSRRSPRFLEQLTALSGGGNSPSLGSNHSPLVFPPPLVEAYLQIKRAIATLSVDMEEPARQDIQRRIQAAKRILEKAVSQAPDGLFQNAVYLADWLLWLIGRKGLSGETISNYYQAIQVFIFYKLGDEALDATSDPDELIDFVAECMHCYDNANTQAAVREGFRSFFNWLASRNILPKLQWNTEELKVYRDAADRPVFTFKDIDRLLKHVTAQAQVKSLTNALGLKLKVFIVLAFFAGLRRREAARLTLQDVEDGLEFLLWIRRSKTKHGIRLLRLDLLLLEEHIELIRQQVTDSLRRFGLNKPLSSIPLLPDAYGDFCPPSFYSDRVRDLMNDCFETGNTHLLRHSFATMFLIRADIAIHGLPHLLPSTEFGHRVFFEPAMTRFKLLLFGPAAPSCRIGYRATARPLWTLQSLIGHSCPETTLSHYSHALDWIYSLALQRQGDNAKLIGAPSQLRPLQAGNLLLQSPENQLANGFIKQPTLANLIALQKDALKL